MKTQQNKRPNAHQQLQGQVTRLLFDREGDLGGQQRLFHILVVAGKRGVELVLGRGLQVAVQLIALDLRILHQALLNFVDQVGVFNLRILAHAGASLHHAPQKHEADENKHPEHDRFNARIHQDSSFPAGEKPLT